MRKLKSKDVFTIARLLDKIGFKPELKRLAHECGSITDVYDRGVEYIWSLIALATKKKAEAELYDFLASIIECEPKDVEEMDFAPFAATVIQIARENDLPGFFSSVQKLIRLN